MSGLKLALNIFVLIGCQQLWALGPQGGSGGGSDVGLEFRRAGQRAIDEIKKQPLLYPELVKVDLQKTLDATTVLVTSDKLPTTKFGIEQQDLARFQKSPDTVTVQERRWNNLSDEIVKSAIALHEILGLAGIERTGHYKFSQRFLGVHGLFCENDLCSDPKGQVKIEGSGQYAGQIVLRIEGGIGSPAEQLYNSLTEIPDRTFNSVTVRESRESLKTHPVSCEKQIGMTNLREREWYSCVFNIAPNGGVLPYAD